MRTFRRYVAIGDSTTEGLEDPDGAGGYRGWADRLAEIIANAQAEPLDYANLGVRSLHPSEIRATQFDAAMAPDLLSIFGGANDMLSVTCDFAGIRADLTAIFSEARSRDCTVVTFTMPDLSPINPFGRRLRGRILRFNDIIREEAERYGLLVMDFLQHPIIRDPRLFSEDRLHASELGYERLAAALAWRLGIEGADKSWADPFPEAPPRLRTRDQLAADVEWARRYLAPWLSSGIRRIPPGSGLTVKRPVLTPVPKISREPRLEDGRRSSGFRRSCPREPCCSRPYFHIGATVDERGVSDWQRRTSARSVKRSSPVQGGQDEGFRPGQHAGTTSRGSPSVQPAHVRPVPFRRHHEKPA